MRSRRRPTSRVRGPRRKTEWEGFNIQFPAGSILPLNWQISEWAKWPSATLDASLETFPVDYVTEVDDTLVHTTCQYGWNIADSNGAQTPVLIGVGLIAFNTLTPGAYDGGAWAPGDVGRPPDPCVNYGQDWIWRDVRPVMIASGLSTIAESFLGLLDRDQQVSKAQRKLPPQTGILWVVSLNTNINADVGTDITFNMEFDARFLLKKH